jgi:hypothetical protein
LFAAAGREFVETGSPVVGRDAPFALNPAVEFEALESGIKGAFLDLEDVLGVRWRRSCVMA